jgi:hypothetical protein
MRVPWVIFAVTVAVVVIGLAVAFALAGAHR